MFAATAEVGRLWTDLRASVGAAVVEADEPLRLLTIALLADGHALVEDVPGVGKTLLTRAFARALGLTFSRVQGTPDLLPTDISGSSILEGTSFRFIPGPILFTNVLLSSTRSTVPLRARRPRCWRRCRSARSPLRAILEPPLQEPDAVVEHAVALEVGLHLVDAHGELCVPDRSLVTSSEKFVPSGGGRPSKESATHTTRSRSPSDEEQALMKIAAPPAHTRLEEVPGHAVGEGGSHALLRCSRAGPCRSWFPPRPASPTRLAQHPLLGQRARCRDRGRRS